VNGVQREEELARMIGGSEVSPAVIASAKEMLAFRRGRERSTGGGKRN